MKKGIIAALIAVGFLTWLWQALTPVHPKYPHGSIQQTWNGQIAVAHRSDPMGSLGW